tara:strand:+ start:11725 stop:12201 length:477 start_codon:yes stop_codon:yes gene_type:complete
MDDAAIRETVINYINNFKNTIIEKSTLTEEVKKLIEEYPDIVISEKKKRLRNVIPDDERCHAHKASGERCTRKKKCGQNVCGTHLKGIPHGLINDTTPAANQNKKIDVWTQDICGIVYYIDASKNVYSSHDIMKNIQNPRIIGSYAIDMEGEYSISHF